MRFLIALASLRVAAAQCSTDSQCDLLLYDNPALYDTTFGLCYYSFFGFGRFAFEFDDGVWASDDYDMDAWATSGWCDCGTYTDIYNTIQPSIDIYGNCGYWDSNNNFFAASVGTCRQRTAEVGDYCWKDSACLSNKCDGTTRSCAYNPPADGSLLLACNPLWFMCQEECPTPTPTRSPVPTPSPQTSGSMEPTPSPQTSGSMEPTPSPQTSGAMEPTSIEPTAAPTIDISLISADAQIWCDGSHAGGSGYLPILPDEDRFFAFNNTEAKWVRFMACYWPYYDLSLFDASGEAIQSQAINGCDGIPGVDCDDDSFPCNYPYYGTLETFTIFLEEGQYYLNLRYDDKYAVEDEDYEYEWKVTAQCAAVADLSFPPTHTPTTMPTVWGYDSTRSTSRSGAADAKNHAGMWLFVLVITAFLYQ